MSDINIERIATRLIERARSRVTLSSDLFKLIETYRNKDFHEVLGGSELRGNEGTCWTFSSFSPVRISAPSPMHTEQRLFSELRLIFGIGHAHDRILREEGYTSIPSLLNHPRWRKAAVELLARWERPLNPGRVGESLSYWFGASHPLCLNLIGLCPLERIAFFDVETLGLGSAPVILIAIARTSPEGLSITQYFARSLAEELPMLAQVDRELQETTLLISYNGKAFDWTTLRERYAYYGLPFRHTPVHIDLLHHARHTFRNAFPDLRLSTVEAHVLGIHREGDLPSEAVPEFYSAYVEQGNVGPLVPIIQHNRQDVETLAHLLNHLLTPKRHVR